jgi:MipA family protein
MSLPIGPRGPTCFALASWLLFSTAAAQTAVGPSTVDAGAVPAADAAATVVARRSVEGAVGLILAHRPAFSGSSDRQIKPELAGFVRWGRYTLSGAGGFTTKAHDDVERGLDALLVKREHLRVNLALRFDAGRRESESDQLQGMGNIPATVRARLNLRWEPAPYWAVNLGSSFDTLNRVGGYVVNGSVSRTVPLGGQQRLILGASVTGAGDRYMQTWYGVTPAQAAASGYAVYEAPEGLRDASASATWRNDFDAHWAGFATVSASRLLGPAAASPLALQRNGYGLSVGLARRF